MTRQKFLAQDLEVPRRRIDIYRRAQWTWRACRWCVLACLICNYAPPAFPQALQNPIKDPHRKTSVGFEVDLNVSPETLAKVVEGVANDTVIRGTHVYSKESEIDEAESAKSSSAFPGTPPTGKVFYKVKSGVLAPEGFPGSGDMGVVAIRYVVQTISPQRARLKIDAVFVRNAPKDAFYSGGDVESAEYAEIMIQVRALEEAAHPKPRARTVASVADTAGLQNTLQLEQERLAESKAAEAKFQDRVKKLEFDTMGRVKSAGVPLKASAYDHSSTILKLQKGESVTVLTTTKYWYRIRTEKGDEGWIYYAFLEPLS
jgi:Bacterial SH3 domain